MLANENFALATRHGKEKLFAPAFREKFNAQISLANIDTDSFGTFSGEIERTKSPSETAIAKALAAAKDLDIKFGLANEGAIGPHPQAPFVTADMEWVAFVDLQNNVQLVESIVSSEIVAIREKWSEQFDLDQLATLADLPSHSLIAKAGQKPDFWVRKGLKTLDQLSNAIREFQALGWSTDLVFESDFRAMESPSRQENISQAIQKLISRLGTSCPSCAFYGFGQVGYDLGVECSACGELVENFIRAEKHGCLSCSEVVTIERGVTKVDPAQCNFCNP